MLRTILRQSLLGAMVIFAAAFFPIGLIRAQSPPEYVSVSPNQATVGTLGTYIVTYTVGPKGVRTGGGIKVELPRIWAGGERESARGVQSSDPNLAEYVSARTSNSAVKLKCEVLGGYNGKLQKSHRVGLEGFQERYFYVTLVTVIEGSLRTGDKIEVIYGDRSHGSPGYTSALLAGENLEVLVASDPVGDGHYTLLRDRPTLTSVAGEPTQVFVTVPSVVQVNEHFKFHVAVVDKYFNPVTWFSGQLLLNATAPMAVHDLDPRERNAENKIIQDVPSDLLQEIAPGGGELNLITFLPGDRGIKNYTASFAQVGVQTVFVDDAGVTLRAGSNPVRVVQKEGGARIYWGDLHSHSQYSFDGIGWSPFDYARDVSDLDFYANTDHSRLMTDQDWEVIKAAAKNANQPGRFVTIPAYEASLPTPYGHHNVFFLSDDPPLVRDREVSSLEDLWNRLKGQDFFTAGHHPGIHFSHVAWGERNDRLRPVAEIYSLHGQGELDDPTLANSYEHTYFSVNHHTSGPYYVRDGWRLGNRMGTIAGSDDHFAQPGKPMGGLTAIYANTLTRAALFEAIRNRHVYATTGERLILDFTANGHPMGSEFKLTEMPDLHLSVIGTAPLAFVELWRCDLKTQTWKLLKQWFPHVRELNEDFLDADLKNESLYYFRVQQQNTVEGRPVMAWSSPIWVTPQSRSTSASKAPSN